MMGFFNEDISAMPGLVIKCRYMETSRYKRQIAVCMPKRTAFAAVNGVPNIHLKNSS